jgi:hypothetical protein
MSQFNPDKNLFSVAPVGQLVIIGHKGGLKSGLPREQALNLAAWLLIASNASPGELQAAMDDARSSAPTVAAVQAGPGGPIKGKEISPELAALIASQMKPIIGTVDAEEGAAIAAAAQVQGEITPLKVPVVDAQAFEAKWGGQAHG